MRKLISILALSLLAAGIASAQENEQYNQYGVKVNTETLTAEAQDGILVLRSKGDSGYKIWFDNRVQVDGAAFFGEPEWADGISNDFSIRRARFAVKAQIDKDWYGEVDMDMANGVFELKDAIIRYTTQLQQWLYGKDMERRSKFFILNSSLFTITEAYMMIALFVSTRDPRLRDAAKAFRKNHPDCPKILGTFINKVRDIPTVKPTA